VTGRVRLDGQRTESEVARGRERTPEQNAADPRAGRLGRDEQHPQLTDGRVALHRHETEDDAVPLGNQCSPGP